MDQKGFISLFVALSFIFIVGIAGGAYYLGRQTSPEPLPQNLETASQAPKLTRNPSSAPDETTNWLTLKNNSCNLSLQYPPTWTIKLNKEGTHKFVGIAWDGCVIHIKNIDKETEYIFITSMASTKTWQEVQESLSKNAEDANKEGFKDKVSEVKINGQIYKSSIDETLPEITYLGTYFRNTDQLFSVIGYYVPNPESQNNFYKILESIKFNF